MNEKFKNIQSLPKGVRENLPIQAQEIYLSTYNSAYTNHNNEEEAESIAHRIAWSSVKQSYEKSNDKWHKK